MQRDAIDHVWKCKQCQRHAPLIHQLVGSLNPINNPRPFAQWGLNIINPFPRTTRNRRFILVAVDYFTKWAKAEALANVWDVDIKKFVWKNIVTRFGVLKSLMTMGCNLTVTTFASFVATLASRIDIQPRYPYRAMVKPKQPIKLL